MPSSRPSESVLRVTGFDVSVMMELERRTRPANQPDFVIVAQLLAGYAQCRMIPTIRYHRHPHPAQRIPSQQCSDFAFIQQMADRSGFVFYVEPTPVPGVNKAYFGPDVRLGDAQSALSLNMTNGTNVDQPLHFRYDALGPASPQVTIVEGMTGIRHHAHSPTWQSR